MSKAPLMITIVLVYLVLQYVNGNSSVGEKLCRERDRLVGSEQDDNYKLVESTQGETVSLECHYCGEEDDDLPKVWYFQSSRLDGNITEVNIDTKNDNSLNRIVLTYEHTLVIKNTSLKDVGIYYCRGVNGEDESLKYNYFLDLTFRRLKSPVVGNISDLNLYQEKYIAPVNQLLKSSEADEMKWVRKILVTELEILTEWGEWSACNTCNRSSGERSRIGHCRIKPHVETDKALVINGSTVESGVLRMLGQITELSCRSVLLAAQLPAISNLSRNIPDFQQTEFCVGSCMEVSEQEEAAGLQYLVTRKRIILGQGGHVTLSCPGVNGTNVVVWKKDGKEIAEERNEEPLLEEKNPHIAIDAFGSLYISEVALNDSGKYTCYLDNVKVQKITLSIITHSEEIIQVLLQNMTYLLFLFLLCFIVYSAAIFVVCVRRRQFMGYENVSTDESSVEG